MLHYVYSKHTYSQSFSMLHSLHRLLRVRGNSLACLSVFKVLLLIQTCLPVFSSVSCQSQRISTSDLPLLPFLAPRAPSHRHCCLIPHTTPLFPGQNNLCQRWHSVLFVMSGVRSVTQDLGLKNRASLMST